MCHFGNPQYRGDVEKLEIVQWGDTKLIRGHSHDVMGEVRELGFLGSWVW